MSKKLLFTVVLCFALVSSASATYYDGTQGSGTMDNPYQITSVEDLKLLRDRVNNGTEAQGQYYKLTADLNLTSETNWTPIGLTLTSDGSLESDNDITNNNFYGHFDGDNHTITVSIDKTSSGANSASSFGGLFGVCGHGLVYTDVSIKKLNVSGNVIAKATTTGNGEVLAGGIALEIRSGVIEDCKFTGIVSASHSGQYGYARVGGIAGRVIAATVKNCEVSQGSRVNASAPNSQESMVYAGGIAAYCDGNEISNCTARARISGSKYQGGITGYSAMDNYIVGNTYSGAEYGIGESLQENDSPSDTGCTFSPVSISILTKTLPSATSGQDYSTTLEASEVRGVKWEVSEGKLPSDLTLSTAGVISGKPTSADNYDFGVKVSMADFDFTDTTSYTLEVKAGSTPASGGGGGGGCNAGFSILGIMTCAFVLLRKYKNVKIRV